MVIQLRCECGQLLELNDASAGQPLRCPQCQAPLAVPPLSRVEQPVAAVPVPPAPEGQRPALVPPPLSQQAPPDYQVPAILPLLRERPRAHPTDPMLPTFRDESPALGNGPLRALEEAEAEEAAKNARKRERERDRRRQLKMTNLGLTLSFWSIVCMLAAAATVVALVIILFVTNQVNAYLALAETSAPAELTEPGPVIAGLALVAAALCFVQAIFYLSGSLLCCWVPRRAHARPYILVSVALLGAAFGMILIQCLHAAFSIGVGYRLRDAVVEAASPPLILAAVLLIPGGFILFTLFLRALAYFLDERTTGDEVISVLGGWLLLFVVTFPLFFICWALGQFVPFVGSWLAAALLGLWYALWLRQWLRLLDVVDVLRKVIHYEFGV